MKMYRLHRYTIITVLLTVIILLTAIAVTPHLLRNEHVGAQARQILAKWAGGEVRINGSVKVDYFLGATFSASNIEITNFSNNSSVEKVTIKKLSADISWFSLISGKVTLKKLSLVAPKIFLSQMLTPINLERLTDTQLSRLIKIDSVNRIVIRNGTVKTPFANHLHDFSGIHSKIYLSSRGRIISGTSTFIYNKEPHTFSFKTKKRTRVKGIHKFFLKYSLKNSLGSIDFWGDMFLGKNISLAGQQNIRLLNVQKFANWSGRPFHNDIGPRKFHMHAHMELKNKEVTLSNTKIKLDDNSASGVLTIGWKKNNIDIDGTLDIPRLSLASYFDQSHIADATRTAPKPLPFHLLNFLTADLRISAGEIIAPKFRAINSAAAISINSGTMLINIADMKVCQGTASGHIEVDGKKETPKISVLGHFQNFSTSDCLENIADKGVMEGMASAYVSLAAEGKTWNSILKSLAGNWTIKMSSGGQVNMNLTDLFAQTTAHPVKGWNSVKSGITRFENLDISSDMHNGTARIRTVMLATDKKKYSGNGSIHIPNHSLNYLVTMSAHNTADQPDTVGSINNIALQVKGHWNHPEIAVNPSH